MSPRAPRLAAASALLLACAPDAPPRLEAPVASVHASRAVTSAVPEASASPPPAGCVAAVVATQREDGLLYFNGEGGKTRDLGRALALFEEACRCDDPESCFNLGVAHAFGWGVPKDPARGRPFYEKSCALKQPSACFNLGIQYELGQGVEVDRTISTAHFKRGCELGHAGSCQNVGVALRDGHAGAADASGAREAFARACELGDLGGCNDAAVLFESGEGGGKDLDRAGTLYRRACEQSSDACVNLGKFLLSKRGDVKAANAAFRQACEGGLAKGCALAGGKE